MSITPASEEKKSRWGILGAVFGAIAASLCCLGPLVVLALGLGGAWIGTLSALEPFRPFFIALALGALGFAWYSVYGRKTEANCAPGEACELPSRKRRNQILLWVVTVLVLALIALPYFVGPSGSTITAAPAPHLQKAVLKVNGMTCGSCALGVEGTLKATEGVQQARVWLDPPIAVVTYDPQKIQLEDLVQKTREIGYSSRPIPEEQWPDIFSRLDRAEKSLTETEANK